MPGYSGSPVFKGKSILGMIVYSPIQNDIVVNSSMDYGTSVLKSQYILEILKIII